MRNNIKYLAIVSTMFSVWMLIEFTFERIGVVNFLFAFVIGMYTAIWFLTNKDNNYPY